MDISSELNLISTHGYKLCILNHLTKNHHRVHYKVQLQNSSYISLWWTNIAIENGHRNRGFSHEKWWFSIAMLVHQRVTHVFPYTEAWLTIDLCLEHGSRSWDTPLSSTLESVPFWWFVKHIILSPLRLPWTRAYPNSWTRAQGIDR